MTMCIASPLFILPTIVDVDIEVFIFGFNQMVRTTASTIPISKIPIIRPSRIGIQGDRVGRCLFLLKNDIGLTRRRTDDCTD